MLLRRILFVCVLGVSSAFAMDPGVGGGPGGAGGSGGPGIDWANLFKTAAGNPATQDMLKNLLISMLKDPKLRDDAKGFISQLRAQYGGGIVGKGLSWLDDFAGRKSFPLSGDAQLGESFELEEWTTACSRGDIKVIQHFLATDDYSHLLNVADGKGNPGLVHAAFGYLNRDEFKGKYTINIEGFRRLAQDKRITSKSPIKIGGLDGRKPFDEWLLQIAEFKGEKEKQARLDELKEILQKVITPERSAELKVIQESKDDFRKKQEELEQNLKNSRHNKYTFLGSIALTLGGLYYYFNSHKKGANTAPQAAAAA